MPRREPVGETLKTAAVVALFGRFLTVTSLNRVLVKINAFEISRLGGGGHSLVKYVIRYLYVELLINQTLFTSHGSQIPIQREKATH
jgi:hypothetical protein